MPDMKKRPLKLLFLISDWDNNDEIAEVIGERHPGAVTVNKAWGTATSEMIQIIGFGNTEKAVFICLMNSGDTRVFVQAIRNKLGAQTHGAGIAFTVPVSRIAAPLYALVEGLSGTEAANDKNKEQEEMEGKPLEIKNHLVISVLNKGYSEEFMKAAREAGARGGTVFNVRDLTTEKARQFLGISVQEEKEIVIMLTDKDKTTPIMQACGASFGAGSEAEGTIFSLPVDQVMSLNALS
jgi:nitrogen regulatory protein PII